MDANDSDTAPSADDDASDDGGAAPPPQMGELPGLADAAMHGYYVSPTLDLSAEGNSAGVPLRNLNEDAWWSLSSARPQFGIQELLSANVRERRGMGSITATVGPHYASRAWVWGCAAHIKHKPAVPAESLRPHLPTHAHSVHHRPKLTHAGRAVLAV